MKKLSDEVKKEALAASGILKDAEALLKLLPSMYRRIGLAVNDAAETDADMIMAHNVCKRADEMKARYKDIRVIHRNLSIDQCQIEAVEGAPVPEGSQVNMISARSR